MAIFARPRPKPVARDYQKREAGVGFRFATWLIRFTSGSVMGYALPFALTGFGVSAFVSRIAAASYGLVATYRNIRTGAGGYALGFGIGSSLAGLYGRNIRQIAMDVKAGLEGAYQIGKGIRYVYSSVSTLPSRFGAQATYLANCPGFASGGGLAYGSFAGRSGMSWGSLLVR